jgi:carbamoylphosphate synthase large subunit
MASDANPVQTPVTSLVHGSQAPTTTSPSSGKTLPPAAGKTAPSVAASAKSSAASRSIDVQAQVAFLNKYLNDSGRPNQFRVAPNSDSMLIQEVNPATGAVVAEYSSVTFPALAKSLGISSAVIDDHA